MIGIFFNTSQQRKKAEQLYQRQAKFANLVRLSSMGEMASIISHEISQPLVVINTYIAGCIRRLQEDTFDKWQIIAAMKKANEFVQVAGTLIHRMKYYIGKDNINYEKVNIHHIIERAIYMLSYDNVKYPIKIIYDFAKALPLVEVDEFRIKFVILSLLNNSIDSITNAKRKNAKLIIKTAKSRKSLEITIKDSGTGIPQTIQNKLFISYCKTKDDGSGLSLLICKSIIESHSGNISAQNLPEGGAAFKVTLPLHITRNELSEI